MSISAFSFLMAILWCNVFIIFTSFIRKQTKFITYFSVTPLVFCLAACILRLLFVFELPHTTVIQSSLIFPAIIHTLEAPMVSIANATLTLQGMFLLLWMLGSIFFFGRYLHEARQLRALLRKATPISSKAQRCVALMRDVQSASKNKTAVTLVQSNEISSPMVFGFLHPTILLPEIAMEDDELRYVLLHKWNHFLLKDAWLKLFVCFICVLFWWNPFVHILKSSLNHILELRCDAKTVAGLDENQKLQYLRSITKVLRYQLSMKNDASLIYEEDLASVLIHAKNPSIIEQRFRLILEKHEAHSFKPLLYGVYTFITAVFVISNFYIIQPVFPCTDLNTYNIAPEDAYLQDNHDGTYSLYSEGEFKNFVEEEALHAEPFSFLEIR